MPKQKRLKKEYRIFSHTADIGLFVKGKTRARLFENAAEGMISLMMDAPLVSSAKKISFRLHAQSWELLLVKWLQEILYRMTVKRFTFFRIKISKLIPYSLEAIGFGSRLSYGSRALLREIKAVTYHDLKIRKEKRGYSTKIVFDI